MNHKIKMRYHSSNKLLYILLFVLAGSVYVNVIYTNYFLLNLSASAEHPLADVREGKYHKILHPKIPETNATAISTTSISTTAITTTTAISTTTVESIYELDFLKCPNFTYNCGNRDGALPLRMCIDTPQKPYPECGVGGLLRPVVEGLYENPWMVFLIKSAPGNIERRDKVRHTWGTVSKIRKRKFVSIFLIGKVTNEKEQKLLDIESETYNDILQCDFMDSYWNLTSKLMGSFRWILASDIQATHYASCDDDSIMNMWNIYMYYTEMESFKGSVDSVVCGFFQSMKADLVPHRDPKDKWYISHDSYSAAEYPMYCYGGLWSVSHQTLNNIYCASEHTNTTDFFVDDVFVTGVLREKISSSYKELPIKDTRFKYGRPPMKLLHIFGPNEKKKYKTMTDVGYMQQEWHKLYEKISTMNYVQLAYTNIVLKMKDVTFTKPTKYNTSKLKKNWKEINREKN